MVKIRITWQPLTGYRCSDTEGRFSGLLYDSVYFYKPDGSTVALSPAQCCGLSIPTTLKEGIRHAKKADFSRGDAFALRVKGDKGWSVYIPESAVTLEFMEHEAIELEEGYTLYERDFYRVKGETLYYMFSNEPTNPYLTFDGEYITFFCNTVTKNTKKGDTLDRLRKDIYDTCHVDISYYDMKELFEHYRITKIRKPKGNC